MILDIIAESEVQKSKEVKEVPEKLSSGELFSILDSSQKKRK